MPSEAALVSGWTERMESLDLQKSAGSSVACSCGLGAEEKTYIWAL